MLSVLADIFLIKARRLLKKVASDQTTQRYERLLAFFGKFTEFYQGEFLESDRMLELEEEDPQVYFKVKNILTRAEDIMSNLAQFMEAVDHKQSASAVKLATSINQQAVNINEDIDSLINTREYEDIFEYEGKSVDSLFTNFLTEVAQISLAKNLELGTSLDFGPVETAGPMDTDEEEEDEESPESVAPAKTNVSNKPKTRGGRSVSRQVKEQFEQAGQVDLNPDEKLVARYMKEMVARQARAKAYREKNRHSSEYKLRQAERDKERKNDVRKQQIKEYKKRHRLKLIGLRERLSKLKDAYNSYMQIVSDPKALSVLREFNPEYYNQLFEQYIEYKRLKESEGFDKIEKKLETANQSMENDRERKRLQRQKARAATNK